ncbi:hypothetical protein AB0L13_42935 [Saccharopolyspora shandongensis]|uniref:hypothetical protein n=1 Tax=Saccharopolyspora shandongensis TaxID=418495 RepID=UPI003430CAD6
MAVILMLLTAACGVQPSGVIRGASPPSGPVEPGDSVTLYLVANGQLSTVQRPSRSLSRADTLALLATGPTGEERARGLTSDVPNGAAPFSVTIEPPDRKVVTVSVSVDELSDTAIDQIVCTAAEPGERVTVLGVGQARGPRDCPVPG